VEGLSSLVDLFAEIGERQVEIREEVSQRVVANDWREALEDGAAFDFEAFDCWDVLGPVDERQRVNMDRAVFFENGDYVVAAAPLEPLRLINLF
jgi:hypothetical protein